MMPFISLELRWFLDGGPHDTLKAWFHDKMPQSEIKSDPRGDIYLFQPGEEAFGIKLRKKKPESPYSLEVKWRESIEPFKGPYGTRGNVERWLKWGWEDPAGPGSKELEEWLAPTGPWLTVDKVRLQRKYRWEDGGFAPESPDAFPAYGAAVELASLHLRGRPYSTVLIETFAPDPTTQRKVLAAAIELFWRDYPKPMPESDKSYGYPAWLSKTAK